MGKPIQLVAVIPKEYFDPFVQSKKLKDLDTMPQVNQKVKHYLKDFISDNVGFDESPIACLSKYNGQTSDLKKIGLSVSDILPTRAGSSLWQLAMPEDMVVSIGFEDLLKFSSLMEETDDPDELVLLGSEFKDNLVIGYSDSDDAVSFIPFIELSKCKVYGFVDEKWNMDSRPVPGVEQIRLVNVDVF